MPLPPYLSREETWSLLHRAETATMEAAAEVNSILPLINSAGLTVRSTVLDGSFFSPDPLATRRAPTSATSFHTGSVTVDYSNQTPLFKQEAAAAMSARQLFNPLRGTLSAYPIVLSTTGGYSNTDHIIHQNPDGTTHKLSEYKRRMRQRLRQAQSEERGTDRWDLPRIPGGRRRRLKRDLDRPTAPPKPPDAGYVIYVTQMTTKLRHDNPDKHHNQISAIRKISHLWQKLAEDEREHYNLLAKDAQREYVSRLREYRATGMWPSFTAIQRLGNKNKDGGRDDPLSAPVRTDCNTGNLGPWVSMPYERKNELERELETYEQTIFPPRPKVMEEEHERKVKEQKEKRRKKIRQNKFKYY